MTTASESINPGGGERRLHPWSWLFVLIQQVKSFALPLLVLLFTGRGNSWELWGLAGGGVLVLVSLLQYFFYRFRVEGDGIVIRSGVLQKSHRHIPYQRVHNVAVHQSLLHRLFGVAEVRLESAGGMKPEAEMRVLSLVDAQALEELVRAQGADSPVAKDGDAGAPALPESRVLLAMSTGEVVRLGLISNRGVIAVAAAFGLLAQADMLDVLIAPWAADAVDWGRNQHLDWMGWLIGALALLLFFVVALRALSVVLALLQFHGFTLTEQGRRLSAQRGLLTRLRANMPRSRIQAWSLREGLLHRWFGRPRFQGWDNQVRDEVVVQLAHERAWRRDFATTDGGWRWDAIGHAGGAVGNLASYANAGAELRFGKHLPDDFGSNPLRIGGDNSAPGTRDENVEAIRWHGFIALDGRWVGNDIVFDGNTSKDSHSVDPKHAVADLVLGVAITRGPWKFTATHVRRTREFEGQPELPTFGTLTFSRAF